jgi:hypothetical protein
MTKYEEQYMVILFLMSESNFAKYINGQRCLIIICSWRGSEQIAHENIVSVIVAESLWSCTNCQECAASSRDFLIETLFIS